MSDVITVGFHDKLCANGISEDSHPERIVRNDAI